MIYEPGIRSLQTFCCPVYHNTHGKNRKCLPHLGWQNTMSWSWEQSSQSQALLSCFFVCKLFFLMESLHSDCSTADFLRCFSFLCPQKKMPSPSHFENRKEQLFCLLLFPKARSLAFLFVCACVCACVWSESDYPHLGKDDWECSFAHPISQERALATEAW